MIQEFDGKFPVIADSVFIAKNASVIGDVEIGEHSSVWFQAVVRGDVNYIRVGRYTNIQDGSVVHVDRETSPARIGDYVTIGHRAIIHGCTIGDHCLIGMGAIILSDAVIGDYCLVAAGAVVREGQVIPPRSVVVGVPARILREVTPDEIRRIEEGWRNYVELKDFYRGQGL
ncbi:MAG TPA: gamma carbonic anhydrase family protein [Blastocatellia bacterium]|nr:gamma carbonic anhydrase family protein [Blastocatellia bacterium]